jgi:hypothetical protein
LTEWKEFGPGAFLSADDQTIQWQGPIESVPSVLIQYTDFLTIDGVLHNSMSKDFPAKNLHIESSANLDLYKIEAKGLAVAIIMAIIGLPFLPSLITELRQPKTQKVNRSRARRSQRRIQRKKPHTQAPNTKKPRS